MRAFSLALVSTLVLGVLAGCIGETDDEVPPGDDVDPVRAYTLPETITSLEEVGQLRFIMEDGTDLGTFGVAGIWLEDDLLYTSGGSGLAIVNISDPTNAVTLGYLDGDQAGSRDVDIMHHPNGATYAVMAGSPGIFLVNVTDPRAPARISEVEIGFHNMVTVPGTPYVYNSRSLAYNDVGGPLPHGMANVLAEGGIVDIVDFTDPLAPVVTEFRFPHAITPDGAAPKPITAPGCHDISINADSMRAYCAGITETLILNIANPLEPEILQVVENPGTNIHHAAWGVNNDSLLVIGDELGGALFAPGCTIPDQPYGGVWFVDISDLAMPQPLGYWAPTANMPGETSCTAHFGNFIDEHHDVMIMSFYRAGVFAVDYSDPSDPVEIANYRPGGSVWEGVHHRGHVYTGDTQRGVDILLPTGEGQITIEG